MKLDNEGVFKGLKEYNKNWAMYVEMKEQLFGAQSSSGDLKKEKDVREKTEKIAKLSISIDKKIHDEYHYLMECGWKQSEITTELLKGIFLEIQYVDLYVQLEVLKLIINTWENSKKIIEVVARTNIIGTKDASNFVGYLNDTIVPVLQTVVIEISRLTDKEGQKE